MIDYIREKEECFAVSRVSPGGKGHIRMQESVESQGGGGAMHRERLPPCLTKFPAPAPLSVAQTPLVLRRQQQGAGEKNLFLKASGYYSGGFRISSESMLTPRGPRSPFSIAS